MHVSKIAVDATLLILLYHVCYGIFANDLQPIATNPLINPMGGGGDLQKGFLT